MYQPSEKSRVTLRDIASEMGISVSAVNKALNDRSGVSEALRRKVIDTAERMGYRVNRMAQSMSRNPIHLGIIMPNLWPLFYGAMKSGMDYKLEALADYRIAAEYYFVTTLHSKDQIIDGIRHFIETGVDALIICPNFVSEYDDWLDVLAEKNIPVVLVDCELPHSRRLCCVRHDANLAGRLAAEFMQYILPSGKRCAIFIGNKSMDDHQNKVRGFIDSGLVPVNPTADVFETLDDPEVAYVITQRILRTQRDIGAIYVATSNTVAVCQAICDEHRQQDTVVIGTDVDLQLQPYFVSGPLRGVIFQDPFRQGKVAVEILFDYLTLGKISESERLIYPHFVLGANFPYYARGVPQTEL